MGVVTDHVAHFPQVTCVEHGVGGALEVGKNEHLLRHTLVGRGDHFKDGSVIENELVLDVAGATLVFVVQVVVDVGLTKNVGQDSAGGNDTEGGLRTGRQLMRKMRLALNHTGDPVHEDLDTTLDITSTVSVLDGLDVGQVEGVGDHVGTDNTASSEGTADGLEVLIVEHGGELIRNAVQGVFDEVQDDVILANTDDLGQVGGDVVSASLALQGVVQDVVLPGGDHVAVFGILVAHGDGAVAHVFLSSGGLERVTGQLSAAIVGDQTEFGGGAGHRSGPISGVERNGSNTHGNGPAVTQVDGGSHTEVHTNTVFGFQATENGGGRTVGHLGGSTQQGMEDHLTGTLVNSGGTVLTAKRGFRDGNADNEGFGVGTVLQFDVHIMELHVVGHNVGVTHRAETFVTVNDGQFKKVGFNAKLDHVVFDQNTFGVVGLEGNDVVQNVGDQAGVHIELRQGSLGAVLVGDIEDHNGLFGVVGCGLIGGTGRHDAVTEANMETHDGDGDLRTKVERSSVHVTTEGFTTGLETIKGDALIQITDVTEVGGLAHRVELMGTVAKVLGREVGEESELAAKAIDVHVVRDTGVVGEFTPLVFTDAHDALLVERIEAAYRNAGAVIRSKHIRVDGVDVHEELIDDGTDTGGKVTVVSRHDLFGIESSNAEVFSRRDDTGICSIKTIEVVIKRHSVFLRRIFFIQKIP